ncbi:holin [Acidovorax sp.]|uniref:holin n=1 Tax=Acidovorax sp. TaxID=1872122 RepID=UPI00391A90C5
MSNHAVENAGIVASKVAAYGGAGGAVVAGLTLNELGVIVGIFVAVVGLVLGQIWSWRKDRRETREQEIRMRSEFGSEWNKL